MSQYNHVCQNESYEWSDEYRFYNCPWCGGIVSNDVEVIEDKNTKDQGGSNDEDEEG